MAIKRKGKQNSSRRKTGRSLSEVISDKKKGLSKG